MKTHNKLIVLLGPTASGKTALAVQLALALDGEIISADSRQVYKGLNIGTGKDLAFYSADGKRIKYYLIDHVEPGDKYNIQRFKEDFFKVYTDIVNRGKIPILCGGTGMYIQHVLQPQDFTNVPVNQRLRLNLEKLDRSQLLEILKDLPSGDFKVDVHSKKRLIRAIEILKYLEKNIVPTQNYPNLDYTVIGLSGNRTVLRSRIALRLNQRMEEGMVDEVKSLLKAGITTDQLRYFGLEYKHLADLIEDKVEQEEMVNLLNIAIRQYAKRQETYFRKMEKDGIEIHWLDFEDMPPVNLEKSLILIKRN